MLNNGDRSIAPDLFRLAQLNRKIGSQSPCSLRTCLRLFCSFLLLCYFYSGKFLSILASDTFSRKKCSKFRLSLAKNDCTNGQWFHHWHANSVQQFNWLNPTPGQSNEGQVREAYRGYISNNRRVVVLICIRREILAHSFATFHYFIWKQISFIFFYFQSPFAKFRSVCTKVDNLSLDFLFIFVIHQFWFQVVNDVWLWILHLK